MMNPWAFMLLGFLVQASHGCVQISIAEIEENLANTFSETFITLKSKPLPDIDTAKMVEVKDVTVTSLTTKATSEGKLNMSAAGIITISSDCFPDAIFSFEFQMQFVPGVIDGHYRCDLVHDSLESKVELTNSLTSNNCAITMDQKDVEKSFEEKCKVLIKGLFLGAINSAITAMNDQHIKLTETFKFNGHSCHFEIHHYDLYSGSLATYLTMYCDNIGPLNNASAVALNIMNPDEILMLYMEEDLCTSVLASVTVSYEEAITEDECNGAFSPGTGDLWLSFTSNSFPKCSISADEATATFSLYGYIHDASGNTLIDFYVVIQANIYVEVISGIVKPSLGEVITAEMTPTSAVKNCDCNKPLERLGPVISKHTSQVVKDISCGLGVFKAPAPMLVMPNNAECSNQEGQFCCVQKKSES